MPSFPSGAEFRTPSLSLTHMTGSTGPCEELKTPSSPFGSEGISSTASTVTSSTRVSSADNSLERRASGLPVWRKWREIVESVKCHQVTMVVGETGSGKTTQIPQMLLEHFCRTEASGSRPNRGAVIAVTQPRRIAAITLANRVLSELRDFSDRDMASSLTETFRLARPDVDSASMDTAMYSLGGIVGFSVRFQSQASRGTRIKFLTDGILLREALIDPLLRRYRIIIIDEAHERSLRTDILLGLLKSLLPRRKDLRVIVMSATLDYRCFTSFFGQGNVLLIPGRQHLVQIYHTCSPVEDVLQSVVDAVVQIHVSKPPQGDILVFLPGQEQIEAAKNILEQSNRSLHDVCSEFAQWWGVLDKLKAFFVGRPCLWKEFLAGQWDRESLADPAPCSRTEESETLRQSKNPEVSEPLRTFLSDLNERELRILRQSRQAFSTQLGVVASDIGTETTTTVRDKYCDPLVSLEKLRRLVLTPSTHFIVGEEKPVQFLQQTLSDNSSHRLAVAPTYYSLLVVPMYAALPPEKQQIAFSPTPLGCRKVILATNIAETSLTIPGVKYVVDSALFKCKTFNPRSGVEALKVERVSRAMANQRAGRAGREGPGECYRLYTEQEYYSMSIQVEPEIKRCNLSQVVLELKMLGVDDVTKFPFVSTPSTSALDKAIETLKKITALDSSGHVTSLGKKLAALPLAPEHGKFLLDAVELGCTSEALTIVALLNTDPIWIPTDRAKATLSDGPRRVNSEEPELSQMARKKILCTYGDHLTLLNAYLMWDCAGSVSDRIALCKTFGLSNRALLKAKRIRKQLKDVLLGPSIQLTTISSCLAAPDVLNGAHENSSTGPDVIRRCLVKSFQWNIARLESRLGSADATVPSPSTTYLIEESRTPVHIHPLSGLFGRPNKPEYVVFSELVETSKLYIRTVTAVEGVWLAEYHPQLFSTGQHTATSVAHRSSHQSYHRPSLQPTLYKKTARDCHHVGHHVPHRSFVKESKLCAGQRTQPPASVTLQRTKGLKTSHHGSPASRTSSSSNCTWLQQALANRSRFSKGQHSDR